MKRRSFNRQALGVLALMAAPQRSVIELQADDDYLRTQVFETVGKASMCWGNISGAGVFQTEKAEKVGNDLLAYLRSAVPMPVNPIRHARKVMTDAFASDPNFRRVYQDNIECLLMDRIEMFRDSDNYKLRCDVADALIRLIFEERN